MPRFRKDTPLSIDQLPPGIFGDQPDALFRPDERLVDERTAAAILGGVMPGTLRVWRCKGRGPKYLRIAGSVRYRVADLKAFIDEAATRSGEAA